MARTSHVPARRAWVPPTWAELTEWPEMGPFAEIFRAMRGEGIRVEEFIEEDKLVVRAELPGIDPDKDVTLTVDNGMLRINAEREESSKSETAEGYRSEFRYGTFTRVMALPRGVTEKDITASYADGILEIRMPVTKEKEKEGAHKIPIQRS